MGVSTKQLVADPKHRAKLRYNIGEGRGSCRETATRYKARKGRETRFKHCEPP